MLSCAIGTSGCVTSRSTQLDKREKALKKKQVDLEGRANRMKLAESRIEAGLLKLGSEWKLKRIIVAARDLKPKEYLSSDSITVSIMPSRFVSESMLLPSDVEVALGRELVVGVKRGEPLFWFQLEGILALQRLSKNIRKGGRALTLSVTEATSVGRWIRPNDHVDVLFTFKKATTTTLVEDVIVLATGERSALSALPSGKDKGPRYRTVTLLVLPEEAERLVLAQENGTLYLTLRNAMDKVTEPKERQETTLRDLQRRGGALLRKRRELFRIRVMRGPHH